jgi:NRAMP (natural resistance-associated macrophage protein)-like metal ion transporter
MDEQRFSPKMLVEKLRRVPSRVRRSISEYRFYAYLAILGPGIISASSGNEVSGIATYSTAGAEYGYTLLWTFLPMTIFFMVAQEMCVRMGVVTGQGLADLIREQFGVRWTAVVMVALLLANTGIIVAEFVGIAQASELLGVPRIIAVPLAALLIWWLVVHGTPRRVEQVFLLMSLIFITYIFSAFLAKPDWMEVGRQVVSPTFSLDSAYLFTVIALIGTTITPFMQIYIQSSVVEKRMDKEDLKIARADAFFGVIFANGIAAFIVISTAATLYSSGVQLQDAADAALALSPVLGEYATIIFAIGLLGAAMLAMGVLPLATAYSLSEALGFEKGLSRSFREAPIFLGIFTALIVIGALIALIPGIPQFRLLVATQCVNGLLLPVILIAIVLLANNREIMGEYRNGVIHNIFAIGTTAVVSCLSFLLIGKTIADMF